MENSSSIVTPVSSRTCGLVGRTRGQVPVRQSTVHVAVSMIIRSCGSVFLVDCLFVDWLVGWLVGLLVYFDIFLFPLNVLVPDAFARPATPRHSL